MAFIRGASLCLLFFAFRLLNNVQGNPNYTEALEKSILFFQGQRSGKLPKDQQISWRSSSGLWDGSLAHQENMQFSEKNYMFAKRSKGPATILAIGGPNPEHILYHDEVLVPESEDELSGRFYKVGFVVTLSKDVPTLVSSKIEDCLNKLFGEFGISDWNSLFYIVHPGGPAIINAIEAKLGLKEEKLSATRHVLREYGNMSSPSVIFIMDEMRKRYLNGKKTTTGDGLEWGVLTGIGLGLTIVTIVLRSCTT